MVTGIVKRDLEIVKLHDEGLPFRELTGQFGLSRQRLSQIYRKLKLGVTNYPYLVKYRKGGKGKLAQAKYSKSKKGKEARRRYWGSEKGRATLRKYYLSKKGQLARKGSKLKR